MTDHAEIELLLNKTGRTLEGLPDIYPDEQRQAMWEEIANADEEPENRVLHQSDVIELLVGALRDSEPKRGYGACHHCKNGTYSYPIRYASFCDECGRDLRVERAGVVKIEDGYEPDIKVNNESMIQVLTEAMEIHPIKPKKDYEDRFAARIRIEIEYLGDLEPEQPKEDG